MKKSRLIAAAAAAALALSGCGKNNAAQDTAAAEEEHDMNTETVYTASEDNVKLLGRTYFDGEKLFCSLSGTGVEFTFTGTKCAVTVIGDVNAANSDNEDNRARIGVYLNGERVIDDIVDQAEEVYEVFKSDTAREATVSVVKLSESPMSTIAIKDIKATGSKIAPTPNKDILIEFIGDSITCGYGIDDLDENHHFSTKTEDVTKAYAYKTAAALNADYSMVSFSGYGIISGYTDSKKVPEQTVPKYYGKLGFSWAPNGTYSPSKVDWDFSKRQPDVIVLNLGTNDDSYTKTDKEKQEEYRAEYVNFIKQIRENNPDAKILCVLGIMGDRLFTKVQAAVDDYVKETGDTNISAMKFDVQDPNDGYAADWHPSPTTHDKAAKKLAAEIKSILGK